VHSREEQKKITLQGENLKEHFSTGYNAKHAHSVEGKVLTLSFII
jgi:hypothetical protein